MNKRDKIVLCKIVEEAAMVARIINDIDEQGFLVNDEKMRSVCMTLINIGELVKNLSDNLRLKYQNVPWKDIAGFRDVTAHGYFTLRMQDVWIYASGELPVIAANISEMLDDATWGDADGNLNP